MKRNKSGISLIVLVITIIVMVILAAAIIISLDNAGVINKANDAVQKTDLKQVQHIASLAWSEAYINKMDDKDIDIEDEVYKALEANKIDATKYNIEVTDNGVIVTEKGAGMNKYGFYFDVPYEDNSEEAEGFLYYWVFKSDNTAEMYAYNSEERVTLLDGVYETEYTKNKITVVDYNEIEVQDNGRTIIEDNEFTYNYSDKTYHDVYYGEKYYVYVSNDLNIGYRYIIFKPDNSVEIYGTSDNLISTITGTSVTKSSHIFEWEVEGETYEIVVSMDGKSISAMDHIKVWWQHYAQIMTPEANGLISFSVNVDGNLQTYQAEAGMTWEEWIGSKYDTLTTGELLEDEYWYDFMVCINGDNKYIIYDHPVGTDEYVLHNVIYSFGFPAT